MCSSDRNASQRRHLMIISRYHPSLYEYVRERFAREENVEIILDRRRCPDRRSHPEMPWTERRSRNRRRRPEVDLALRRESMQFLTIPPSLQCPQEGCPNAQA